MEEVIHSELGPILPALGIWPVGDRGRSAPASVRFCGFWHLQIFLGDAFRALQIVWTTIEDF